MESGKKEDTPTGDLPLWCIIDDDAPEHNPYIQSARSRSTSKKHKPWPSAPQFGPLPTAGSIATEAPLSSQAAAPEAPVDSRFGPLPIVDDTGSQATTMPKEPATENHYRRQPITEVNSTLHRQQNLLQTAKTSGIRFDALLDRVPSDRNPEGLINYLHDASVKQTTARVPTEVANFYPPTHPALAAQRTRDADGGTRAELTCGRHVSQHRDHDESTQSIGRLTPTTAPTRCRASRLGPLPVVDGAGAEAEEVPQHQAHQNRPSASRFGPLPIVDSTAAEPVVTPKYPAARTAHPLTVSEDSPNAVPLISHLLTEDERHALIEHLVNTVTEHYAALTPAHGALVPVARADPLDQEDNTFHVLLMAEAHRNKVPDPAIPPAPTTCCAPAEAPPIAKQFAAARRRPATAASGIRSSSGAMTPSVSTTDRYTPVARRLPAGTVQGEAASSQGDGIRVRRTTRDDSLLKNETVCFCDGSTFLYFGCLLRPEVLMVPTPMPSLEAALKSVYNFQPSNEIKRVIFWLSDSQATPLSPALQFRMVTELSRHYVMQYPAVKQYVVVTPTIGSRQDVWTCGLFKLLVQMEVVLPYADVIMITRGSRSVTHADVYHLQRFLRDHHYLDLWSRYDADFPQAVKASHSCPTPQQRHAMRATSVETPNASQPLSQRRSLPGKTSATSMDGTTSGTMHAGHDCLASKEGSRQHGNLRARPAAQSFIQFPPPPSRSRFHSTPLSAPHDPTQARKLKARSGSRSALPAARKLSKTNSRAKKKEHPLRDGVHHGSKEPRHQLHRTRHQSNRSRDSPANPDLAPCRSWTELERKLLHPKTPHDEHLPRQSALSALYLTGHSSALHTAAPLIGYGVH